MDNATSGNNFVSFNWFQYLINILYLLQITAGYAIKLSSLISDPLPMWMIMMVIHCYPEQVNELLTKPNFLIAKPGDSCPTMFRLTVYISFEYTMWQFLTLWILHNITQILELHIFDNVDEFCGLVLSLYHFNVGHCLVPWYLQDPPVKPECETFQSIDYSCMCPNLHTSSFNAANYLLRVVLSLSDGCSEVCVLSDSFYAFLIYV